MLNNMVASFSASNQVGEMMKKANRKQKPKSEEHPTANQTPTPPETPQEEV
ncbi:hypothetical protein D3C87_1918950 [compost metagenome]